MLLILIHINIVAKLFGAEHAQVSSDVEVLFHEVLREESKKPNYGPRALKHVNQQVIIRIIIYIPH